MIELKEHIFSDIDEVFPNGYCGPLPSHEARPYYLKSEADKVIAELEESHKMEVEQLLILNREQANAANRLRDNMEQTLRRQKKKRCLVMAKWCDEVMMSCELRGYAVHRMWTNRHQWAMRWKYKWLAIAEKFKTNSTAKYGKGK